MNKLETIDRIESLEEKLLQLTQVSCPLEHKFAPGIYLRTISMPAGTFIIGQEHKTEHFNVVLSGKARVLIDGEVSTITGPCTFISGVGIRKVLLILEDMKWSTVHATSETDVEKLEDLLITKSHAFLKHEEVKQLMEEKQ